MSADTGWRNSQDDRQPRRGKGWHWLLPILVGACIAVVILPMAAAPVARAAARASVGLSVESGTGSESADDSPSPSVLAYDDLGVRRLPLLTPETEASIGDSPDETVVYSLMESLAADIGLSMDELDAAQQRDWKRFGQSDTDTAQLLAAVPDEAFVEHESQVVDLANLQMIRYANDPPSLPEAQGDILAGLMLERASAVTSGCDTQLSLAYFYAARWPRMSREEHSRVTQQQLDAALAACGHDATALWVAGTVQTAVPQQSSCVQWPNGMLTEESLAPARETFEQLIREFPELPAGYVGLAAVDASIAGNNDYYVIRPFTARQTWSEAVELLERARRLTTDERVAILLAQALCRAGHCDEAAELLNEVDLSSSRTDGWATIANEIFRKTDQFERMSSPPVFGAPHESMRDLSPRADTHFDWDTSPWGLGAAPAVGGSQCGSGWLVDLGFLSIPAENPFVKVDYASVVKQDDDSLTAVCRQTGTSTGPSCDLAIRVLLEVNEPARAERLAQAWVSTGQLSVAPTTYLGLALLKNDRPDEAFFAFQRALDYSYLPQTAGDDFMRAKTLLRLGYASQLAGRDADAERSYLSVFRESIPPDCCGIDTASYVKHDAYLQLGDLYMHQDRDEESLRALLAAQEAATHVSGYYPDKGVAANNAALVAMRLGDYELALEQAEKAVSLDPASPVFLETLADAKRRATGEAGSGGDSSSDAGETAGTLESGGNPGEIQCAFDDVIASYQEALAADSSSSLAWNNLGVVHAACQQGDEARQAFQNSIRANPEYAKGWFNYGSYLLVEGDWTEFLIAEGALGIAGSLDRALRDEGPALSTDEDIYDTGLDLSQALPADWKLGEHERRSAAPITIMLIVLTLFRVVTELAREDVLDRITSVTMNKVGSRFAHLALPGTVGLALSTVLLVVLSSAESKEQLLLIPVAFAAVALPSMIRAMGNSASAEVTPAPILVATAVLVPFGAALPPLAGARGSANVSRWKAAAAPAAIAVLALVAVGVSLVASVPLERATLTALVAILTTTLLPTPPYDGAKLTGWRSQLATIGMGLIAVLFALRLV